MIYIKQIMNLFNCDEAAARKVFQNMVLDFSEATTQQFEREAQFIWFQIITIEQDKLS
jgi:hypothetical protein